MTTAETNRNRFLLNPYNQWAEDQGIPIYTGFCIDLLDIETGPWSYSESNGALVHLHGKGDYAAIALHDLPPGKKTRRMQHCFEEIFYVLEGYGSTSVTLADGVVHSFEWGPKSLFAIPLNCPFTLFNGSGRERARLASTNDLPISLKLYHNYDFIFRNPFRFNDREGPSSFYVGDGELQLRSPGQHTWETNFIPDLGMLELQPWDERGDKSMNIMLLMSDGTMHAHVSEMPVGTYKKAHRHGPDFHVFCVEGEGFSQFWYEGNEGRMERFDWKPGCVFAPADQQLHLHFNKGATPCRYFAAALGSRRYPFNDRKEAMYRGVDKKGDGAQIEYRDQPFECHLAFLAEMEKRGLASRMGNYIDETPYFDEAGRLRKS